MRRRTVSGGGWALAPFCWHTCLTQVTPRDDFVRTRVRRRLAGEGGSRRAAFPDLLGAAYGTRVDLPQPASSSRRCRAQPVAYIVAPTLYPPADNRRPKSSAAGLPARRRAADTVVRPSDVLEHVDEHLDGFSPTHCCYSAEWRAGRRHHGPAQRLRAGARVRQPAGGGRSGGSTRLPDDLRATATAVFSLDPDGRSFFCLPSTAPRSPAGSVAVPGRLRRPAAAPVEPLVRHWPKPAVPQA